MDRPEGAFAPSIWAMSAKGSAPVHVEGQTVCRNAASDARLRPAPGDVLCPVRGHAGARRRVARRALPGCAVVAMLLLGSREAHAGCNVIPGATQTFRASQTTVDRPYSAPGDFVTLGLDPTCYTVERAFSTNPADQVVTVVFTPPQNGPRNVVVLASSARCAGVSPSTCPGAITTCLPIDQLQQPIAVEVPDPQHLRFRFPDTDGLVRGATDALTLTGAATIAVTRATDPLPCALTTQPCAGQPGLLACVDSLFAADGTCGTTPDPVFPHFTALPFPNDYQALCTTPSPPCTGLKQELRFTVDTAGNVLLPMDWRGILVNKDAVPVPRLLRASTQLEAIEGTGGLIRIPGPAFLASYDSATGRKIAPIFDPQVDPQDLGAATFFGSADAPIAVLRVARRTTALRCAGGTAADQPCGAASDCPGGSCAPRFLACAAGSPTPGSPCTVDQDCGGGTRSCGEATCSGGKQAGHPCQADADCPGGEGGAGLFSFTDRLLDGMGPVVLRPGACVGGTKALAACTDSTGCPPDGQCGSFVAQALDPVPLDGLVETPSTFAFVREEAIGTGVPGEAMGQDLNGDGDTTDHVVTLVDRTTGQPQSIGADGAPGRAVARIEQPPFSFPAVAAEEDVVAFLEPEPGQGNLDENHNGRVFDTVVRVFRLGAELTSDSAPITADAAPLINGRSLGVSNRRVFFRTSEAAVARQTTTRVSVASDGTQGNEDSFSASISADGRFVAFGSDASSLVACHTHVVDDVFVHARVMGGTARVSVASDGTPGNNDSGDASISADGRFVAFES